MPIEIRELIVKINIDDSNKKTGMTQKEMDNFKNKVIKECLDKVMHKLKQVSQR